MLKVMKINNIGLSTQNIFLKICKILLGIITNEMRSVEYNLFILRECGKRLKVLNIKMF
jgi:hypothetical protein